MRHHDRQCAVCGESAALLLIRVRGGGCVRLTGGWAVCTADPRKVPALCDDHFNLWLHSPLARIWLAESAPETWRGVGLTAYGFKLLARAIGVRPRVLRRQIVRGYARRWTAERRAKGRHDYLDGVIRQRNFREALDRNPWLAAVVGPGAAMVGFYLHSLRKAA